MCFDLVAYRSADSADQLMLCGGAMVACMKQVPFPEMAQDADEGECRKSSSLFIQEIH